MKNKMIAAQLLLLLFVSSWIGIASVYSATTSAWTWAPPTIDGIIDTDFEWAGAAGSVFVSTGGVEGVFYVMNDDSNVYMAVRTTDSTLSQDTNGTDSLWIYFDNDDDGVGPEVGDDMVGWFGYQSQGFRDGYSEGTYSWHSDTDDGGTSDGSAAATNDGTYNYFEISHPLDTADDTHDFSLSIGETIGFMIRFTVDGIDRGWWPSSYPATLRARLEVIPEFPILTFLSLFLLATLTVSIANRRKLLRTHTQNHA